MACFEGEAVILVTLHSPYGFCCLLGTGAPICGVRRCNLGPVLNLKWGRSVIVVTQYCSKITPLPQPVTKINKTKTVGGGLCVSLCASSYSLVLFVTRCACMCVFRFGVLSTFTTYTLPGFQLSKHLWVCFLPREFLYWYVPLPFAIKGWSVIGIQLTSTPLPPPPPSVAHCSLLAVSQASCISQDNSAACLIFVCTASLVEFLNDLFSLEILNHKIYPFSGSGHVRPLWQRQNF